MNTALTHVEWRPCWRIISSRFPPVQLFEDVADPQDLEAVFEVEAMTNDRLRDQVGALQLVAPSERISGPGTSFIMAAFTHLNPLGSRFCDGSWGVYYAGADLDTAIAETRYHRAAFLRATNEGAMELDMRVLVADLRGTLHDICGQRAARPELYDPDAYGPAQDFARTLRAEGSNGIVYDSVRHCPGQCVAVFRPPLLSNCRQERHLCYVWNGSEISGIYEKRPYGRDQVAGPNRGTSR
ncbi:MAG TPA: RES domain-containing protein [Devosia sp.]|nr:RES domain-containing protein [Devosia sp.]